MKIEIKNLGPISKFTFDVDKDLHLIYGKNSVGKSYAIYCVYILLKKFHNSSSVNIDSLRNINPSFKITMDDVYQKIKNIADEKRGKKVAVGKELNAILTIFFNNIFSDELTESFNNTFSSLKTLTNIYSNKDLEIKIESNGFSVLLHIDKFGKIVAKKFSVNIPLKVIKTNSQNTFKILLSKNDILFWKLESDYDFGTVLIKLILVFTASYKIDQINFLPSSRSGLYLGLNSFAPIIAELSKHRFQLKSKIELPSISEPISDYFIPLASANSKKVNKQFELIVKRIEDQILLGSVSIDNENKKILFQPKGTSLNLDLSVTSSMVSEIAPIVTYLKHIISVPQDVKKSVLDKYTDEKEQSVRKSIIFIEEPEAHLHPEIQVKLMEIFAELTNHNMKVVITSHSNYMFNKLVNMIIGKNVDVNKVVVNNMVMTKAGSVIDENMTVSEEGIDDFNFSETSEKLYEERMNIIE